MFGPLVAHPFLIAQAAAPAGNASDPSQYWQFVPMLAAVTLFLFLINRSGRSDERKKRDMLSQIKKGDKVLTLAGIYGTVVSADPAADKVVLRLDDEGKVRVVFARSAITRVLTEGVEKK